ncbi:16S rRNA (adenine(1518)-N(6)/adenine(1519)-N(6))-dimethyltransferase RsmA [Candidatus Saccharibacteria bacterium]|nr:16S rRNA (adenine(1518)-N(6)/adenine(1519)-N(6))-dimethyltransferase RsmA [Candidatus Saccharibacteria bacterium]
MLKNKKSLGQHWLRDREVLLGIARIASGESFPKSVRSGPLGQVIPTFVEDSPRNSVVLEVGPGLGTLTSALFKYFDEVRAVEYDKDLAEKLPGQFPGKNLVVYNEDFLQFDLGKMPKGYVIAGNIPYYITGKIVQKILAAPVSVKPRRVVLLVQKEVAERMAACGGKQSLLGLSCAIYAEVRLGEIVKAEKFTPPPKVDSQVVVLEILEKPCVPEENLEMFWKLARAGFLAPRKKLSGNLAGFFNVDKAGMREILTEVGVSSDARAEDLPLAKWIELMYYKLNG